MNGISRVNTNTLERTMNVAYGSRITDTCFIQMILLNGYKTVEELGRIF
ncbi:hypothetical protein [Methanosarcina sp. Kolksee]|nr:hypothetical protein [Methanosarcina sp. Kolksee]